MSAIRRIALTKETVRTPRPDRVPTLRQSRAASAVIVPLFPRRTPAQQAPRPVADNIFADLAQAERARPTCDPRLSAARARMAALMAKAKVPQIDNLFRDDCPDVPEEILAAAIEGLKSQPRPLSAARKELCALHDEEGQTGARGTMARHLPQVAAVLAGLVAYAQFGAHPAI